MPTAHRLAVGGLAAALVLAASAARAAGGGDPSQPGAYCPLPEKGQPMRCMGPAQREYGELLDGLGRGRLDGPTADRLEADVRGGREKAVIALSALTWSYYTLLERAAQEDGLPEEVAARLQRWNELVASTWASQREDAELRDALALAAVDLHERTRGAQGPCAGLGAASEACRGTTELLRRMGLLDDPAALVGLRGVLARLVLRFVGEPDAEPAP